MLLGLKPELLDFAAPSGSVVSVAAADTPRTAIVQRNVNITVNCSEWFDENPGDNTYITQAPLDEMGNEVYFEYRLEPIVTDTRIIDHESVTFLNTYNDLGARDPDHSLLRCYSCMTSEDDLVTNCQSASVAVFVIGSAPEIDAAPQDGEDDDPVPTVVFCLVMVVIYRLPIYVYVVLSQGTVLPACTIVFHS